MINAGCSHKALASGVFSFLHNILNSIAVHRAAMPYSKPVTRTHYHCSDMENEKYIRKHFFHFFIRHPSFGPLASGASVSMGWNHPLLYYTG